MQIPKSLELAGFKIKVSKDPMLKSKHGAVGMVDYGSECISLQSDTPATPISRQSMEQTYLHELVHYIFYLAESDTDDPPLHNRECLVDRVSGLLHQALNSYKGEIV